MTITQLEVIRAIADLGNFSRAAEQLSMTQSAVSHAVATLEREIGASLFDRGPGRPVRLTALGQRIDLHARELLRRSELIAEEATSWLGFETGKVRIASVGSVAARVLPAILTQFRARHPRVELVVHEGSDSEVHDWLGSGAADLGLLAVPLDGLDVLGTMTEDLFMAFLPVGHPLAGRDSIRPADLVSEPFIMSSAGCEPLVRAWFGSTQPSVEYQVRALDTLVGFVREGLGVTLMPTLVHPDDLDGLAIVPLDPPARRRVVVAAKAGVELSPAAAAFVRDLLGQATVASA